MGVAIWAYEGVRTMNEREREPDLFTSQMQIDRMRETSAFDPTPALRFSRRRLANNDVPVYFGTPPTEREPDAWNPYEGRRHDLASGTPPTEAPCPDCGNNMEPQHVCENCGHREAP